MIPTLLAWLFLFAPFVLLCMPPLFLQCSIFSDDFSSNDIANYDQRSGSWTISSGVLTTTSSGSLIVANTAGSTGHGRVQCDVKSSTNASTLRLIGSYVDDSNYVFAEATINSSSGTFSLWKRVAGVNTQIDSGTVTVTLSTGTFYTVDLCWNGTTAKAGVQGVIGTLSGNYTGTGNKAGLGGTPASSGTNTFDNFSFSKHYDDESTCTNCGGYHGSCTQCSAYPAYMQMVVTGMANAGCTHCTDANGTWVLPWNNTVACEWRLQTTLNCGLAPTASHLKVRLKTDTGNVALDADNTYVNYSGGLGNDSHFANANIGLGSNPGDCTTINGVSGTWAVDVPNSVTCDGSASSITITAL